MSFENWSQCTDEGRWICHTLADIKTIKIIYDAGKNSANGKDMLHTRLTVQFSMLALGARFRYPGRVKTYVKIGPDLVAEWDSSQIATGWTCQDVYSAAETDGHDFPVVLV